MQIAGAALHQNARGGREIITAFSLNVETQTAERLLSRLEGGTVLSAGWVEFREGWGAFVFPLTFYNGGQMQNCPLVTWRHRSRTEKVPDSSV